MQGSLLIGLFLSFLFRFSFSKEQNYLLKLLLAVPEKGEHKVIQASFDRKEIGCRVILRYLRKCSSYLY